MSYQMWDPARRPDDTNTDDPAHGWVRGVPQGTSLKPQQLPLPWKQAFRLFFHDHRYTLLKRAAARYAPAALVAIGFADDAALPVLGLLDEPLTLSFLAWCAWRINKYRKIGK